MSTTIESYIAPKFLLRCMYSEEWQKVKTKVPLDLWKKVEVLGFDSPDKAVINALEKLVSEPELNIYGKEQEIRIQELKNGLEDEKRRNQELQKELELRIEEAQKQIKDLQKELEKAERREIYFEEMHNNYMMQVQTLINQKQIAAPGANKPWWRFW